MLAIIQEAQKITNGNFLGQVSAFANSEKMITYLVGLPIIFAILLFIYGIFKFVFAGSSKSDRDAARRMLWAAVIIILIAVLLYAAYSWIYGASLNTDSLPNVVE
ncbi:MAG: hypothetical protein Q8N68_01540 [bacterium]|nr:hypothetical protein [bacterium]